MDYLFTFNAWVYYLGFVLCAFIAVIAHTLKDNYSIVRVGEFAQGHYKRAASAKIFTFIIIGYLVFWAAVRNGIADTHSYIVSYNLCDPDTSIMSMLKLADEKKGVLFDVYILILKKMGLGWEFFLASVAIFCGCCIYYGISKYSDNVVFSCFLFMASMNFYWLFNGIRQFIVVSLFFASFRMLAEKKLIRFLLFVFIMYYIHSTAIILIPIYFIVHMKNWSIGIYTCILTTMVIVLVFPDRVNEWIDNAFSEYRYLEAIENDDGVSIFRVLVALVTPTFAFIYRKPIEEYNNKYVNIMVNTSLITAGVYAVAFVSSGVFVGRLPIYTEVFNLILLPFIIDNIVPKRIKTLMYLCCIIGFFMFFHLQAKDGGIYYTTYLFDNMDLAKDLDMYKAYS